MGTADSVPAFGQVWTADFPYLNGDVEGGKHRVVLVLSYNPQTNKAWVAKVTSQRTRQLYAGNFAIYPTDKAFKQSGLHKESRFDLNQLAELPFDESFTHQIGALDFEDMALGQRFVSAVKTSEFRDAIVGWMRKVL